MWHCRWYRRYRQYCGHRQETTAVRQLKTDPVSRTISYGIGLGKGFHGWAWVCVKLFQVKRPSQGYLMVFCKNNSFLIQIFGSINVYTAWKLTVLGWSSLALCQLLRNLLIYRYLICTFTFQAGHMSPNMEIALILMANNPRWKIKYVKLSSLVINHCDINNKIQTEALR